MKSFAIEKPGKPRERTGTDKRISVCHHRCTQKINVSSKKKQYRINLKASCGFPYSLKYIVINLTLTETCPLVSETQGSQSSAAIRSKMFPFLLQRGKVLCLYFKCGSTKFQPEARLLLPFLEQIFTTTIGAILFK